jgi:hypothetical protein
LKIEYVYGSSVTFAAVCMLFVFSMNVGTYLSHLRGCQMDTYDIKGEENLEGNNSSVSYQLMLTIFCAVT